MRKRFDCFAAAVTGAAGSAYATVGILVAIAAWLVWGPFTGFSDQWQLWANTVTTLLTNVLAFLILNCQNRDTKALHAKLDELLRGVPAARAEAFVGIERPDKEA